MYKTGILGNFFINIIKITSQYKKIILTVLKLTIFFNHFCQSLSVGLSQAGRAELLSVLKG